MKHLIDPTDLTLAEIDDILVLAEDIINNRPKYAEVCKGKKLATLFLVNPPTNLINPRFGPSKFVFQAM